MAVEISQIMFFTDLKTAIVLTLLALAIYILRNLIGKKLAYGIIVLILGVVLLGLDKILEMTFGAVAGALIFSHIQDIIRRKVEHELESSS